MRTNLLFFLCQAFLFCNTLVAQQLPVTAYAPRNGALFSGTNSIFQDSNGWMWFATGFDVVRYDGHIFKTYPPVAGSAINYCYKVLEIDDEIWVLSDPYPMKIVGDSLQKLEIKNIPGITSYLKWKNRHLFLCSDGLYEFDQNIFRPLLRDASLAFNTNEELFSFNDSLIISYQWDKKLVVFNLVANTIQYTDLPVNDMRRDKPGKIYILLKDRQGIFELRSVYGPGKILNADIFEYASLKEPKADFFIIDAWNNLWVAAPNNYLMKINPDKSINLYKESDGLPSTWFQCMFLDRENNIWIGSNSGVCKIKNIPWKRYTKNEGLFTNHILFFGRLFNDKQIYILTTNGVNAFSGNQLRSVRTGASPFYCEYLIADGHQIFYLRDSALYAARLDTVSFNVSHERKLSGLPAKGIQMTKNKKGTFFIGTTRGLFAYHHNRLEKMLNDTAHYHCVLSDSRERLWVGRFAGELLAFSVQYKKDITLLASLNMSDQAVSVNRLIKRPRVLVEDKSGNIYAGTRYEGLFYIHTTGNTITTIERLTEKEKLSSNTIWGLALDTSGSCWAATGKGLNSLSKKDANWIIRDEGVLAQLHQSAAVFATKDNNIWVASHPGVLLLNRESLTETAFSTFITDFFVNGKPIEHDNSNPGKLKKFGFRENNISIDFSANTFFDEEGMLYSYRLLRNGNGEWSSPVPVHSVAYPALLPGSYRFEVKSKNNSDTWSSNTVSLSFEILPPFWQRAWFVLLLALTALAVIYLLYRYRIKQLMKLQEMRNSISRNLHDDIGASLSNINILNTLAMRNLADKQKAESLLQQSGEDIQRISESLSDIVWSINPLNDDLDNLLSYMKRYAADMLEGKNIAATLEFPAPGSKVGLTMDKRNDFFLIFKEAVNNMVKYSKATAAKVIVKQERNMIYLLVEDNGVGFVPGKTGRGNGLKNMQHRADALHATLNIESESGKGTRVELKMKIQA